MWINRDKYGYSGWILEKSWFLFCHKHNFFDFLKICVKISLPEKNVHKKCLFYKLSKKVPKTIKYSKFMFLDPYQICLSGPNNSAADKALLFPLVVDDHRLFFSSLPTGITAFFGVLLLYSSIIGGRGITELARGMTGAEKDAIYGVHFWKGGILQLLIFK